MHIEETQLKDFIIDSGLVSRAEVLAAAKEGEDSGESLGRMLVRNGKITEDNLRRMQAYVLGIPFVDLKNEKLDFDVLSLIPEPIARNHNIVAFRKTDSILEVAMLDTEDLTAIDFVKKKVGLKIMPRLTDGDSMKSALLQYQKSLKAEFGDLIQKEASSLKKVSDEPEENVSEIALKKLAEDVPVVRIVDTLLKHAILQDASDIHIEPMEDRLRVRLRVNGVMTEKLALPLNFADAVIARIKVLSSSMRTEEKRIPQDGRLEVKSGNKRVDDNKILEIEDNNKKFKIMNDSMNEKERKTPELIFENYSRKIRLSKGSGISIKKIEPLEKLPNTV